ncbi:MAG: sigma-70 family RNA polymerase sigma factor [Planctomycetota bacterium]
MADEYLEDPDVKRMLRVREGDESAFEELVAGYGSLLMGFMQRFVGPSGPVEDLAQDVFLKVHRAAKTYEPRARFKTWLLAIATNVCLNEKRRAARHFQVSLDQERDSDAEGKGSRLSERIEDDGSRPEADMDMVELKSKVRSAIDALPDNQRMAILLARFEQMSYADIGATMELSVMAVKSLLNRAKNNLKDSLSREIQDFLVLRADEST